MQWGTLGVYRVQYLHDLDIQPAWELLELILEERKNGLCGPISKDSDIACVLDAGQHDADQGDRRDAAAGEQHAEGID